MSVFGCARVPHPVRGSNAPPNPPPPSTGGLDLAALNKRLEHAPYLGGFSPSREDAAAFEKVAAGAGALPQHVQRWAEHLRRGFSAEARAAW